MDKIERDTRSKAAESYCNMIRDELQPKGESVSKPALDPKGQEVSDAGSAKVPVGRRALQREIAAYKKRVETLEASMKSAPATVVAAVAPAKKVGKGRRPPKPKVDCPHCQQKHPWAVEDCFSNPDCRIPVEKRYGAKASTTVASITEIPPEAPK